MKAVRLLVAHGHDVARLGIRSVIEAQAGWSIVAEAGDGDGAVEQTIALQPDIAIVDLAIPGLNGLEAIRQIRQKVETRILAIFVRATDGIEREVFGAGAHGYVLNADTARQLVPAVRALLLDKRFARDRIRPVESRRPPTLTPRELEVLKLLAQGLTNKEIAKMLRISPKTAETHRSRLMTKLDIHSIAELVRYAIRHGVADP